MIFSQVQLSVQTQVTVFVDSVYSHHVQSHAELPSVCMLKQKFQALTAIPLFGHTETV